jgi:uncharacterized membrane protein YgdD (TMEM256/DUF423 family)
MAKSQLIALGALDGLIAVAAGAFGAHALKDRLDARSLEIFETAARYQMYHALAIVLCGALATRGATNAGWAFQIGIVIFSGSLYALALSGVKGLGAITPLGGLAFLVGWGLLAWSAWRG